MNIPEFNLDITPDNIDDYLSLFAVLLDKLIEYKKELQEAETDSDEELIQLKAVP